MEVVYFNQIPDFVVPVILVSETWTIHGKGKAVPVYSMKAYRGIKVQLYSCLTWALYGGGR
jgi:hypothetical protein